MKQNIKMIGVELRPELVSLCMEIRKLVSLMDWNLFQKI